MFNLTSAPVLFHLEKDPSLYAEIEKGLDTIHAVNYQKVKIGCSKNNAGFIEEKQKTYTCLVKFRYKFRHFSKQRIVHCVHKLYEFLLIEEIQAFSALKRIYFIKTV